ncbi:MAG TPA: hypothetical protein VJ019_12555 [Aestuariivirga sp.]|jgi:hypothetical protein|nr:hypothetical protein [Aestuariivirga sp.]
MEAIERAALISVSRACSFCGLAIICVMVGFSYEPVTAARLGSILCFALTGVLVIKAQLARSFPFKRTETWLMLANEDRPPSAVAQGVISGILRDVFLMHARYSTIAAIVLLLAAVALSLLGAP